MVTPLEKTKVYIATKHSNSTYTNNLKNFKILPLSILKKFQISIY